MFSIAWIRLSLPNFQFWGLLRLFGSFGLSKSLSPLIKALSSAAGPLAKCGNNVVISLAAREFALKSVVSPLKVKLTLTQVALRFGGSTPWLAARAALN